MCRERNLLELVGKLSGFNLYTVKQPKLKAHVS